MRAALLLGLIALGCGKSRDECGALSAATSAVTSKLAANDLRGAADAADDQARALAARTFSDDDVRSLAATFASAAPETSAAARAAAASVDRVAALESKLDGVSKKASAAATAVKDAHDAWSKDCGRDCAALASKITPLPQTSTELSRLADDIDKMDAKDAARDRARALAKALRAQADALRDVDAAAAEVKALAADDSAKRLDAARARMDALDRDVARTCRAR